ncbi:hypothetical protein [Streptomyces sp. WAC06614]|uniref:hypothetical protein n=1 Tax=Streptomyces sp. WAC06614 TaxID=2487416 RepID=UPI000F78BBC8|nr:hypothetical protein [Streptomyces sp. WAC06614]RSS51149.1 hypothetical protein EF918_35580 [Streptomyces sp. WAC06614]
MTRTETTAPARHPHIAQVSAAGSALAVALVPLVLGVLLAKAMAADPLTPVNALIAGGGQRARMAPTELRRRGGDAVRRLRAATGARRAAVRCGDAPE